MSCSLLGSVSTFDGSLSSRFISLSTHLPLFSPGCHGDFTSLFSHTSPPPPTLFAGVAQTLQVRDVASGAVFEDPGNILVGVTSDLTVEVQCNSSESGTETEWYRNGSLVPRGLEAFGVTQGEGGILRVHPAGELRGGAEFVCSVVGATDGEMLPVVFNLGGTWLEGVVWCWASYNGREGRREGGATMEFFLEKVELVNGLVVFFLVFSHNQVPYLARPFSQAQFSSH